MSSSRLWLDTELEWVWLVAERLLRRLRVDGLRPELGHKAAAAVDALIERRQLTGAPAPSSLDELEDALATARELLPGLRPETPVGRLLAALGCSARDFDLLVLTVAPHIEPGLATMFAFLQDDATRPTVDIALAADLLGLDRSGRLDLLAATDADSPLVRMGVLAPTRSDGRSALHRQLQPVADAIPLLLGRTAVSPGLTHAATLLSGAANLDGLILSDGERQRLGELATATSRLVHSATPPWLVLWGPRGAGKRELATRIAGHAEAPLLALDTRFVAGGQGDEQLRRAQRDALANDAVLFIGPIDGELLDNGGHNLTRRLHDYPGAIIFGVEASEPPRFCAQRPVHEIQLRPLDREGRRALWSARLPPEQCAADVDVEALARSFKLTPGEIAEASAEALTVDAGTKVTATSLRRGIDRLLRNELSNLAQRVERLHSLSDLVLPLEQVERVRELIDRHRFSAQVFETWELGSRIGYGRGVVALFSGPPGTGKTMLAGVVARELGLDLYKVDLSQVVSKWVGETEKQLARIFELAERAHAVLLFDEADSLLAKRTKVETANDRHGNLAVNYLLQRFEDYDGVAILTTNRAKSLDEAINRRLTMHLRLDIPEETERRSLWRSFVPPTLPIAADVDLDRLARDHELAGGNIKNVAVRAAFYAASQRRDIDMALIQKALRMEMQDMGRLA